MIGLRYSDLQKAIDYMDGIPHLDIEVTADGLNAARKVFDARFCIMAEGICQSLPRRTCQEPRKVDWSWLLLRSLDYAAQWAGSPIPLNWAFHVAMVQLASADSKTSFRTVYMGPLRSLVVHGC